MDLIVMFAASNDRSGSGAFFPPQTGNAIATAGESA
jgi:hypothetical protein